tara:strand:+ start:486 stop:971 length:486 start_codon:yes stop_codon:yes gene_type:complete
MTEKKNKLILIYIFIFLSISLVSAFLIEFWLGHEPCKLCLYQRIPYILAIFLLIKIFFIKGYEKITLLIMFLIFLASSILAFYHFGIEQGFFNESYACVAENFSETTSKEEILKQLKENNISCKDVSFKIMGLSLASINTIFSIILSVIFLRLYLNYEKNR